MNYCSNCGQALEPTWRVCPNCANPLYPPVQTQVPILYTEMDDDSRQAREFGIWAIILSFFPACGIVLGIIAIYYGWKGKGSTGLILGFISITLSILLSIVLVFSTIYFLKHM